MIPLAIEEEKQCARCKESWPADEEFFRRKKNGQLYSYCRACEIERVQEYHRQRKEKNLALQEKRKRCRINQK